MAGVVLVGAGPREHPSSQSPKSVTTIAAPPPGLGRGAGVATSGRPKPRDARSRVPPAAAPLMKVNRVFSAPGAAWERPCSSKPIFLEIRMKKRLLLLVPNIRDPNRSPVYRGPNSGPRSVAEFARAHNA